MSEGHAGAPCAGAGPMNAFRLSQMPWLVKVAVGITLFNAWILFAEVVVDRQGLWRYIPGYRVGLACTWDLFVAVLIVVGLWWASRKRP